jgi:hypothetical protein
MPTRPLLTRRRILLAVVPILAGATLVGLWHWRLRYPTLASLHGEAYYLGQPTSYWRDVLRRLNDPQSTAELKVYRAVEAVSPPAANLLAPSLAAQRKRSNQLAGNLAHPEAVGVLRDLLRDTEGDGPLWACLYLSQIGPHARPATPALLALMRNGPTIRVQQQAALALWGAGPEHAEEAFRSLMRDDFTSDTMVTDPASWAEYKLPPREALPTLRRMCQNPTLESQHARLRRIIVRLDPLGPEAGPDPTGAAVITGLIGAGSTEASWIAAVAVDLASDGELP